MVESDRRLIAGGLDQSDECEKGLRQVSEKQILVSGLSGIYGGPIGEVAGELPRSPRSSGRINCRWPNFCSRRRRDGGSVRWPTLGQFSTPIGSGPLPAAVLDSSGRTRVFKWLTAVASCLIRVDLQTCLAGASLTSITHNQAAECTPMAS